MFETRKREHKAKVRLNKKHQEEEKIESAETRMGKGDGGIVRHSTRCSQKDTPRKQQLDNRSGETKFQGE